MKNANSTVAAISSGHANETLDAVRQRVGFIPNLFATLAEQPGVVEAFAALDDAFSETSLSPVERQVVLMTASVENKGAYCVAGHTIFGQSIGMPEQAIDAIRSGGTIDDTRLEALHGFVTKLSRNRGHVEPGETARLQDAGYSRGQVLEIIMGVTVKTFTNYVDSALQLELDENFKSAAWIAERDD